MEKIYKFRNEDKSSEGDTCIEGSTHAGALRKGHELREVYSSCEGGK